MQMNPLYTIESFPPLPESIQKMNELCQGDEVDLGVFTQVIESDPLLYADILRYSNAPHHGFRHPILSVSHAIALFGVSAIRGMALTAALKAHPFADVSAYGISVAEWFKTMERQQRFLDLWLGKKYRPLLQSLGGLTFILEIGRLVASYALVFGEKVHRFEVFDPQMLRAEESEVLGASGDELAARLFEIWNFDRFFIDSLEHSLVPDSGKDPVACAALLCARKLFGLRGEIPFEFIEPVLQAYGLGREEAYTAYQIVSSR